MFLIFSREEVRYFLTQLIKIDGFNYLKKIINQIKNSKHIFTNKLNLILISMENIKLTRPNNCKVSRGVLT